MPCGARGIYIISIREAKYRVGIAHISRLPMANISKKGAITMAENKNQLREESIDFAIAVSDICDNIKGCSVFVNQLVRCSSSIGANIHEAKYAQSRLDFISKLEIGWRNQPS